MRGIRISHFRDLKIFPRIKKRLFIWRMACDSCQKCGLKESRWDKRSLRGKIFRSRKFEIRIPLTKLPLGGQFQMKKFFERFHDTHQAEHHVILKGLELKNPSATSCYLWWVHQLLFDLKKFCLLEKKLFQKIDFQAFWGQLKFDKS